MSEQVGGILLSDVQATLSSGHYRLWRRWRVNSGRISVMDDVRNANTLQPCVSRTNEIIKINRRLSFGSAYTPFEVSNVL